LEVGSSGELALINDDDLSSFLGHLPQSLKKLRLRTVFSALVLADNCKITLLTLTPFRILKEIELDIEMVEEFLRAFLDVCPALKRLRIHKKNIETRVHNLLQEVTQLQATFSKVVIIYVEPVFERVSPS
jgi:hypothetical protein